MGWAAWRWLAKNDAAKRIRLSSEHCSPPAPTPTLAMRRSPSGSFVHDRLSRHGRSNRRRQVCGQRLRRGFGTICIGGGHGQSIGMHSGRRRWPDEMSDMDSPMRDGE